MSNFNLFDITNEERYNARHQTKNKKIDCSKGE